MRDLGKWPHLLVMGDRVTDEQADEILVRTCSRTFFTNDKAWEKQVLEILGIPELITGGAEGWAQRFREHQAAWDRLGNLSLQYLSNSQIASAWIGGPRGWCNWNGWIFCNDYGIGKNPGHESITEEWTRIAETFPYLRLRSQLLAEDDGELAGTWDISDGAVTYRENVTELVTAPSEMSETRIVASVLLGMEQGVGPDRLARAVNRVRLRLGQPSKT